MAEDMVGVAVLVSLSGDHVTIESGYTDGGSERSSPGFVGGGVRGMPEIEAMIKDVVKSCEKRITPKLVKIARHRLNDYIKMQRRKGSKVKIVKPLYYKGLSSIRAIVDIDSYRYRIWFYPKINRWRKA